MTKKELEAEIKLLHEEILGLALSIEGKCLKTDSARKRDHIVRTNYIGRIKDKKIKEDFKAEIEKECGDKFESITNKILNYEFVLEHKNILNVFNEILKKYEYKQIVLDTYGDKKNEK